MKRVSDYALIIGHTWRCGSCREQLLETPQTLWLGYKLSELQREQILELTSESFATVMALAAATGLATDEIDAAIDHPRARLRHLGVQRRDGQRQYL